MTGQHDSAAEVPIIGTQRQLFVDTEVLAEIDGVVRRLHQLEKHPENPVVVADRPWEAGEASLYGSVWRDPELGQLRMWYRTGTRRGAEDWRNHTMVCHAVSADGVHWDKPDVGTLEFWGSRANNIVRRAHYLSDDECGRIDAQNVILDADDFDPARRFKAMSFQYAVPRKFELDQRWPSGHYAAVSADGLRWHESDAPVLRFGESGYGDTLTLMHDPQRGRYVCFCKILTPTYGQTIRFRG